MTFNSLSFGTAPWAFSEKRFVSPNPVKRQRARVEKVASGEAVAKMNRFVCVQSNHSCFLQSSPYKREL